MLCIEKWMLLNKLKSNHKKNSMVISGRSPKYYPWIEQIQISGKYPKDTLFLSCAYRASIHSLFILLYGLLRSQFICIDWECFKIQRSSVRSSYVEITILPIFGLLKFYNALFMLKYHIICYLSALAFFFTGFTCSRA